MSGPGKLYDSADLASALAPALSRERADRIVEDALRKLALPRRGLSVQQATRVLESISNADGLVGVAGRFALARAPREAMSVSGQFRAGLPSMTTAQMIDLFVPSVGHAKAEEVVAAARGKLGIDSDVLTPKQVGDVLDSLVSGAGIVATVARFARARLLLGATEHEKGG